ncbi:MAG: AAA family ATPase [Deltaproteobacteria bacterium]|nr:AAA family ATPase [Deltaproteobacteria bacterium]
MSAAALASLTAVLERPVARRAARALAPATEVGLLVAGTAARFTMEGGRPVLREGAAADPDFTLTLPEAAVARLAAQQTDDVGEMGIAFFQLLMERDPSLHVGVRIQASTVRLLSHGYLSVLALGGMRVGLWLLRKGLADPRAVIERLRRRS